MRKREFESWLEGKIEKKSIRDRISRCHAIESIMDVDLDDECWRDGGDSLMQALVYTKQDAKENVPIPEGFEFAEGANIPARFSDYRSAIRSYIEFYQET